MGAFETDAISGLRDFWQRLLARPDALMLELGAGGKLLVARLRAMLSLVLLSMPLINLLTGGKFSETMIGLFGVVMAIVMSQAWLALARQRQRYRWLPWATATYDVSLTTLVLVILAFDSPVTGLNSMVVWVFYLISIGMTALRNDGRLTLYAGALAILQYGVLVAAVFALVPGPDQLASIDYGTVTASNQIQRLVLLAVMTAITAIIVYRMQKLVDMSGTDGLTGLPNRTWLLHRFPAMLDATRAQGGSLSVCVIDLDYFKRINDELGHLAGDRALRHVVDGMKQQMEDGDWLARLGGEEFALLLPNCDRAAALALAESCVDRVRAMKVRDRRSKNVVLAVTISAGVTEVRPADDAASLLVRADSALYAAKNAGRDRVHMA